MKKQGIIEAIREYVNESSLLKEVENTFASINVDTYRIDSYSTKQYLFLGYTVESLDITVNPNTKDEVSYKYEKKELKNK